MWIGVISLFPEMFRSVTDFGVTGQAVKKGLLSIEMWNPRDFTNDKHRTVDDTPYGGGPGMILKPEPLFKALDEIFKKKGDREKGKVIFPSPKGKKFSQDIAQELSQF